MALYTWKYGTNFRTYENNIYPEAGQGSNHECNQTCDPFTFQKNKFKDEVLTIDKTAQAFPRRRVVQIYLTSRINTNIKLPCDTLSVQ